MKRYTIRNEHNRWLATIVVCDDGLVVIYGMQNGTYGYFWPGPQAFGTEGIHAFLRDVDAHYAADKFTMHAHRPGSAVKQMAQDFVMLVWPFFKQMLRVETSGVAQ